MWDLRDICSICAGALREETQRLDAEQAPHGIDAWSELRLHALLQEGLRRAGYGVHPEQRYPRDAARRKRSEGDRCDIVLTHNPDAPLMDPGAHATLFQSQGVPPDEALWLEVKTAHQHALVGGSVGPDPGYSSQFFTGATRDLRRLAEDPAIAHAAAIMLLFTSGADVARHDVIAWAHRCLDKGLRISAPALEHVPITDRRGNACCSVAVMSVQAHT